MVRYLPRMIRAARSIFPKSEFEIYSGYCILQPVYYGTFEKPGISAEILEFRDPGGTDRTVSADRGIAGVLWIRQVLGEAEVIGIFSYVILMLMPYQVTLVPNYLVAEKLNILNTYWAIWLPGIFSPFAVYLLTKFMKRIPVGVMEAAQIDGAGEWQIYRLICMPLCKGALCSAAILVFIDYWNMVEQPLILLSDAEMHPLSVFLSKINSGEIGLAFAVATIYMVPSLLVFLYGEEYLVDGITYQGGVKG